MFNTRFPLANSSYFSHLSISLFGNSTHKPILHGHMSPDSFRYFFFSLSELHFCLLLASLHFWPTTFQNFLAAHLLWQPDYCLAFSASCFSYLQIFWIFYFPFGLPHELTSNNLCRRRKVNGTNREAQVYLQRDKRKPDTEEKKTTKTLRKSPSANCEDWVMATEVGRRC